MLKFSCAFQPIIDIHKNEVFSYEALLRGKNGEDAAFIFSQVADDELASFDQIIRNKAIKMAAELGITCSLQLNFMLRCLQNTDVFIFKTIEAATQHSIPLENIIVEITEQEVIKNENKLKENIFLCHEIGLKVAIDDFGAGYSGLNLLANYQPDLIKLDMNLIRNIQANGPRQAIVKAITDVCVLLGIDVIAEGVETVDEYHWLRDQNI